MFQFVEKFTRSFRSASTRSNNNNNNNASSNNNTFTTQPTVCVSGEDNTCLSLSGTSEYDIYSQSSQATHIAVTVKAPAYEPKEHTPIDLVISLDVSGSMQGEKLNLAKKAILFVIQNLRAADRLAVVLYDSSVSTLFGLTQMDSKGKDTAIAKVEKIVDGSSTDLCSGLMQGVHLMNKRGNKANLIGSVLLFTDGLANEGISDTTQILAVLRKEFKPSEKYSVHTFGFGSDHNATLLKGISEVGNGMYFFVKNVDEIPVSFADCLGGILTTVAQTMQLNLEGLDGHSIINVHTNKQFKMTGKTCTISWGDIQSEEEKDILFELSLPAVSTPIESFVGLKMTLTYFSCVANKMIELSGNLTFKRVEDVTNGGQCQPQPSLKVTQQIFRVKATEAMKEAKVQAEGGNLASARTILNSQMAKLKESDDSYAKELLEDLQLCSDGMKDSYSYQACGSKYMESCEQTHTEQRSNIACHSARAHVSYSTPAKSKLKSKAFF